ncbi:MAG: cyclic nucleotide-binding domain-containing protein [Deltaproteobacteria bacterium]|nr:cyclic nucleotide-binding domain-containing protein [Deltaproteobacteria bacterium]
MDTAVAVSALRRRGEQYFHEEDWERALAHYAELVRLAPGDHQGRFRAARCLLRLGEVERAITAYHAAAEGLLKKSYLLSAIAACKEAMRINPSEQRILDTLGRIHAKAVAEVGRFSVPPPLPPDALGEDGELWDALTGLDGEELVDKAMEVLARPEDHKEDPSGRGRPPLPLFAELDRQAFIDLVGRIKLENVGSGEILIEQGKPGDSVIVICAGGARVERFDEESGKTIHLADLPGGTLVGEMALLTDAPRTASVVSDRPSEIFVLSKQDLEEVARKHPGVPAQLVGFCRRRLLSNLLNTSPIFAPFDKAAKEDLLRRFQSRVYERGQPLIHEGQETEGLFVILTGEVQVTKKDAAGGPPVTLANLREGEVLGEIGLIRDVPATATVTALRKCAVVMLPGDDFAELISDHADVRTYLQSLSADRVDRTSAAMSAEAEELGEDDLIVL